MQAQVPNDPYVGLWSRLQRFRPAELATLLEERRAVRTVVMRATIHLVSADDCLVLRPLMQPILDRELARHREFSPALQGVDLDAVLAHARELLTEPRTGKELRAALGRRFPAHDAAALAYACRCLLACVQVPPRGVWGHTAQVATATAEAWLARPLAAAPSLDAVVLRYLAAFGPASVADVGTWSRLTGLREVAERLRPQLRVFRDERGRELFDLQEAPRPDEATPAPVRFLPEYDNLLLSHDDRSRFLGEVRPRPPIASGSGTVLHDGVVVGMWRLDRKENELTIRPAAHLSKRATGAVEAESRRLLRFLAPAADPERVRLLPTD